jgi:hypothetical protein
MYKTLGSAIATLMLMFSVGASAELSRVDWIDPGDNMVIRDTDMNLEWLDVSMTAGRSYMDVTSEIDGGGFSGWRVATRRDVGMLLNEVLGARIGVTSVTPMASRDSLFNLFTYPYEYDEINSATGVVTTHQGLRGLYDGGLYYYEMRVSEIFDNDVSTFEYRTLQSLEPLANDEVMFADMGVFLVRDLVYPPANIVDVGAPIMGVMSFLMLMIGFRCRR